MLGCRIDLGNQCLKERCPNGTSWGVTSPPHSGRDSLRQELKVFGLISPWVMNVPRLAVALWWGWGTLPRSPG